MGMVVRVYRHGGPEELRIEAEDVPEPGPGEVRLRQTAIAVNFVDVYHRTGQFGHHALPLVPGVQAAGVVEALGPEVSGLAPGDRVGYAGLAGAYRATRLAPAARLLRVPDDIDDETVAATLTRGLTAHYLLRRLFPVKPGDAILVHAAAGGMGLVLAQWGKHLGATVIGTVGSAEKAAIARAHGCDHAVLYRDSGWVDEVRRLTGGAGVAVAYDGVGRDTFSGSLACLRAMGMGIAYGTASGPVEPFPLQDLHARSLIVTRPTLGTWIADRGDYERAGEEFFHLMRAGTIRLPVTARYPLAEVARAHGDLEGRRTTGALVLEPPDARPPRARPARRR